MGATEHVQGKPCAGWKDHEVPGRGYCLKQRGQVVKAFECERCPERSQDGEVRELAGQGEGAWKK